MRCWCGLLALLCGVKLVASQDDVKYLPGSNLHLVRGYRLDLVDNDFTERLSTLPLFRWTPSSSGYTHAGDEDGTDFVVPDELSIVELALCTIEGTDTSDVASDSRSFAQQVANSYSAGEESSFDTEVSASTTVGASVEAGAFGVSASASVEATVGMASATTISFASIASSSSHTDSMNSKSKSSFVQVTTFDRESRFFTIRWKDAPTREQLSPEFLEAAMDLNDAWTYQKADDFLRDFGSHYFNLVSLGNKLETSFIFEESISTEAIQKTMEEISKTDTQEVYYGESKSEQERTNIDAESEYSASHTKSSVTLRGEASQESDGQFCASFTHNPVPLKGELIPVWSLMETAGVQPFIIDQYRAHASNRALQALKKTTAVPDCMWRGCTVGKCTGAGCATSDESSPFTIVEPSNNADDTNIRMLNTPVFKTSSKTAIVPRASNGNGIPLDARVFVVPVGSDFDPNLSIRGVNVPYNRSEAKTHCGADQSAFPHPDDKDFNWVVGQFLNSLQSFEKPSQVNEWPIATNDGTQNMNQVFWKETCEEFFATHPEQSIGDDWMIRVDMDAYRSQYFKPTPNSTICEMLQHNTKHVAWLVDLGGWYEPEYTSDDNLGGGTTFSLTNPGRLMAWGSISNPGGSFSPGSWGESFNLSFAIDDGILAWANIEDFDCEEGFAPALKAPSRNYLTLVSDDSSTVIVCRDASEELYAVCVPPMGITSVDYAVDDKEFSVDFLGKLELEAGAYELRAYSESVGEFIANMRFDVLDDPELNVDFPDDGFQDELGVVQVGYSPILDLSVCAMVAIVPMGVADAWEAISDNALPDSVHREYTKNMSTHVMLGGGRECGDELQIDYQRNPARIEDVWLPPGDYEVRLYNEITNAQSELMSAQLDSNNRFAKREMISRMAFSVPDPAPTNRGALAEGTGLSGGAIAGVVIGVLLGCAAIAGGAYYFLRIKPNQSMRSGGGVVVSPPVPTSSSHARPTQELSKSYSAAPSVSQYTYAPGAGAAGGGVHSSSAAQNQQEHSRSYSAAPSVSQYTYSPNVQPAAAPTTATYHGSARNPSLNIEHSVSRSAYSSHSANRSSHTGGANAPPAYTANIPMSSTMKLPSNPAGASHRYSSSQGAPAAPMSQTMRVTRPPPPRGPAANKPHSRTPPPSPGLRPYS